MKITYIENVRIPSERAHAYQIAQCCAWLGRFGHTVTLVNPDRANGEDVFAYFQMADRPFAHVTLPVFDALRFPFAPLKPFAYALQRRSFIQSLRRWAKGKTADAWYTRDPAMIDGLRGVVRGRWILELHDAPNHSPARWARVQPLISAYVVISLGLKDDLMHRLGIPENRIAVASDGFDPEEFATQKSKADIRRTHGIPEDAFVAVYAGGFYLWKGVDLAVRAWAKAPQSAYLLLAGGPENDRKRIEALVPPGARNRIRIIPTLPRRDAIALLFCADIGLLTTSSAHEIGRRFTSPIKQFEYMAAGLPVLASDVPSSHEVLNLSLARFYDSTEEGFVDTLKRVINEADWRKVASTRAKDAVGLYTWEARAKRISDFIKTL